jgi:uncharacterized protein (TIGR02145 family)
LKTKFKTRIYALVLINILVILNAGCKKDKETNPDAGNGIQFNPDLTYGVVTDVDGNSYKTIRIGDQTWTAENLRTTRFNDSTPIPLVTDNLTWEFLSTPGYTWSDNDSETNKVYGILYNWHAVHTGKLAPAGWHVATKDEWTILINKFGGDQVAGGKLKEEGIRHWESPNTGATNESGFTALPGGNRNPNGTFYDLTSSGFWWTSTDKSEYYARGFNLNTSVNKVEIYDPSKNEGLYVRCVRN